MCKNETKEIVQIYMPAPIRFNNIRPEFLILIKDVDFIKRKINANKEKELILQGLNIDDLDEINEGIFFSNYLFYYV